jgi:phosphate transport system substrate-binding protein
MTKRRGSAMAGVLALAIVAAACGSSSNNSSNTTAAAGATTTVAGTTSSAAGTSTTAGGATTSGAKVSGTIQGSGSTFQLAYQQQAISDFQKANSGTTVTYGGGGSGKGRTDLKNKTVDFAGSDAPYAAADKPAQPILYFPILLGPITISYNLSGVDKLQLTADTIAKIFSRQAKTWNDPAIAADNPGVNLPSTAITVVHRSDGSGTTQNFTQYLVEASPTVWTLKSGSTIQWPSDTQAGSGNSGVSQIIKQTDGAVGYVDLSDATASNLKFASVKNSSGNFIVPSPDSASAAGNGIKVNPDLTFLAINSPDPQAYPITYQTWVIVYQQQSDASKGNLLKAYINYLIGAGQQSLPGLDYAPLPSSIQQQAMAQLAQIQMG